MHILYYISSHGYGHGVRACAICNRLCPEVELTVRTALPRQFFEEELNRPFAWHEGEFDCGCFQTDGVTVDIQRTLEAYETIAERNRDLIEQEIAWCRTNRVAGIVSDIVPFAFAVAHGSGIPSAGVTNFSWEDIYEPYLPLRPSFRPYFEQLCRDYSRADLLLALEPPNPMKSFTKRISMPVVARGGTNRADAIRSRYGLASGKKIGLIYTGNYGLDSAAWERLESFYRWEFIGVYPIPGNPRNYHLVDKNDFKYQDLSASADLIISKVGYGIYSECVSNGVPLLYMPRTDFAEYPVLENAVRQWGHGFCIPAADYYALSWESALERICESEPPQKMSLDGAQKCAEAIEQLFLTKKPNH